MNEKKEIDDLESITSSDIEKNSSSEDSESDEKKRETKDEIIRQIFIPSIKPVPIFNKSFSANLSNTMTPKNKVQMAYKRAVELIKQQRNFNFLNSQQQQQQKQQVFSVPDLTLKEEDELEMQYLEFAVNNDNLTGGESLNSYLHQTIVSPPSPPDKNHLSTNINISAVSPSNTSKSAMNLNQTNEMSNKSNKHFSTSPKVLFNRQLSFGRHSFRNKSPFSFKAVS